MIMEKTELIIPGLDDFFTLEAYKTLRTNILFSGQDIRIISVTSSLENDGKTTVSLHLGRCFAELGKKVVLLDCDLRKSTIASRNIKYVKTGGVSGILTGQSKLDDCIIHTQFEGYDMILAGSYPPNPVELLGSKYFNELLEELKERYDYIIVDSPPLGRVIDSAVIAPRCDGFLVVIGDRKTDKRVIKNIVAQIQKADCRVLGIVRNDRYGRKESGHGYYKYKYKYGKKYQYGRYGK